MTISEKYGHLLYFYTAMFLLFLGFVAVQNKYKQAENSVDMQEGVSESINASEQSNANVQGNAGEQSNANVQGNVNEQSNANEQNNVGEHGNSNIQNDAGGDTNAGKQATGVKEQSEKLRIALTFDDGPSIYTTELLKGLKKRGVKASFFLLGECIEGKENIVKEIYEEGNLVGNHTYEHVQLTKLSDAKACEKIERTSNMIFKITGQYTTFVRPPYGDWKKGLDLKVQMIPVFWDIDSLDWTTHNVSSVVNRVVKNAHDGAIILMHDCTESSVEAALKIVDTLQADGYEFVTVDDLVFR